MGNDTGSAFERTAFVLDEPAAAKRQRPVFAIAPRAGRGGKWAGAGTRLPFAVITARRRLDSALGTLSEHGLPGRAVRFCRRRREQLLYLVVGGWNTLFAYGEWALLEYLLHDFVHYLAILVISWPLAVVNAYVCYRHFVFRSRDRVWKELPRFSLVYLGTLVASLVALPFLLHTLPFDIYVIQAGFTFVVVILSYLSNKFFSFGGARRYAAAGSREED